MSFRSRYENKLCKHKEETFVKTYSRHYAIIFWHIRDFFEKFSITVLHKYYGISLMQRVIFSFNVSGAYSLQKKSRGVKKQDRLISLLDFRTMRLFNADSKLVTEKIRGMITDQTWKERILVYKRGFEIRIFKLFIWLVAATIFVDL